MAIMSQCSAGGPSRAAHFGSASERPKRCQRGFAAQLQLFRRRARQSKRGSRGPSSRARDQRGCRIPERPARLSHPGYACMRAFVVVPRLCARCGFSLRMHVSRQTDRRTSRAGPVIIFATQGSLNAMARCSIRHCLFLLGLARAVVGLVAPTAADPWLAAVKESEAILRKDCGETCVQVGEFRVSWA